MPGSIAAGPVHHLMLTVSDLDRSRDFYSRVLGYQVAMEIPPRGVILSDGNTMLALGAAPDPSKRIPNDHFDENRVGLDHVSFGVRSLADLERAMSVLDEYGIMHGGINDEGSGAQLYTLSFRDPDNIQLELTAPYESMR